MTAAILPSPDALRLYQSICDLDAKRQQVNFAAVAIKQEGADLDQQHYAWDELVRAGWIRQTWRPCVQVAVMPEAVGGTGIETRLGRH